MELQIINFCIDRWNELFVFYWCFCKVNLVGKMED